MSYFAHSFPSLHLDIYHNNSYLVILEDINDWEISGKLANNL